MMKAIVCQQPTPDMSAVFLTDCDVPEPGLGQVRVRVQAASLNPVDWKLCSGIAPWWDKAHIVGLDGAGVIDALGEEVTDWQIGDRVLWHADLNRDGVLADYALADAHVLSRIPESIHFTDAAALPCAGYTALLGLGRKAHIKAGDVVVIQGGSGGVGGFAIQIARHVGAQVIALVRPEFEAHAHHLGATKVLDYRSPNLAQAVRELNDGEGADIMFEVASPPDARHSLDLLRYNGQLVTIDPLPDLSKTPAYTYAASIHEVALGGAYAVMHKPSQQDFARMGDELLALMEVGELQSMVSEVIPIEEVLDGLQRLRRRDVYGKLVVQL